MSESASRRFRGVSRWSHSRIRFISFAIALLTITAIGLGAYFTEVGVANTRDWIVHTYEVRARLRDLRMQLAEARASAAVYLASQDSRQLAEFHSQVSAIPHIMASLRKLTSDNLGQQDRLNQLEPLLQRQVTQMDASAARGFVAREPRIDSLIEAILNDENQLLETRLANWNTMFRRNLIAVFLAFAAVLFLLTYNFHLLRAEVRATKEKERLQHENAESYRVLSARLIEMQDSERRRIARELHDSVGQYLAGLKINLHQLASSKTAPVGDDARLLAETLELTSQAISEVRTISHLLHPPLLDELGLESAARWYVEGFAKRSGLKAELNVGEVAGWLTKETELALFRVLQEALTNVHRHAQARTVLIELGVGGEEKAVLSVKDDGKGIPTDVLNKFRSGLAAGVGLAGMRERIAELGGKLQVESTPQGSVIRASLPTISRSRGENESFPAPTDFQNSETEKTRAAHP